MSKWKKQGKRILIFLLILGLFGGMMDNSQITATAAEAATEDESPETENIISAQNTTQPKETDVLTNSEDLPSGNNAIQTEDTEKAGDSVTDKPEEGENLTANASEETKDLTDETPEENDGLTADAPEESETPAAEENEKGGNPAADEPDKSENPAADEPDGNENLAAEAPAKPAETIPSTPSQDVPANNEDAVTGQPDDGEDIDANTDADAESPTDADVAAAQELIDGLPSLEELKAFDQEQEAAVLAQLQAAMEAYESLEEEQRAQLPGAEARLKELMDYFTEPAMPMAASDQDITNAWGAMAEAMKNWTSEVDLSSYGLTEEDMKKIWPNVAQDNPDLFYVLGCNYFTDSAGLVTNCQFTYNNQYTQDSVTKYHDVIANIVSEVIDPAMSDEQKATALHDYLVQHMEYDQNANNNLGIEKRNAYEALVNGIGVCQGYTLAYAALLKKAGIEVGYCKSQSMNHIWNYVKLNDQWYHADLTYDDITASSQVGATGYVKHTYFLLSDTAMRQAKHTWEPNGITCGDTSYDNSWHKTAPITESAIYAVGDTSYYLKGTTVANAPSIIYRGATLVKRDSAGTVTEVASFDIENLGDVNGWPLYSMSFSRLSYSKGVLYFNVGNSIYAFKPSVDAVPTRIYRYEDTDKRIVTGLLVNGDKMTLEIYNLTTKKTEKIDVPVFSLTASESRVQVGYTTPPVLTANPAATGFTWSKQSSGGSWQTINGATGSTYTIETGLPKGSYRYRAEATLDGKSVSAEIIIIVTDQEEQKNFAFPENVKTVTYGDDVFTLSAQGAEDGATVRYSSSNPSVASIDSATGKVTIQKAGSAVITAVASETANYLEARSTCTLTVSPKALAWDVSALQAGDRLDLIAGDAATLYGELRLSGILEKDAESVHFECPADLLAGLYETVAEGSQRVTLSWKNSQDKATLQGDGSQNYTMPAGLPQILGTIRIADETTFKTEVKTGISEVPDSFQDKEHLNTPDKIEKEIKQKLQTTFSEITAANTAVYDVELLININGFGWQKATKDNFPSQGLVITLPYPAGTGKDTHDFVVAHMFTENMNGFYAGETEYPTVTKTDSGITFRVYGLSPIAVGWKEVKNTSSGGGNNSAPAAPASKADAPFTGDTSPIMLYTCLALAASGIIIELYFKIKRRKLS